MRMGSSDCPNDRSYQDLAADHYLHLAATAGAILYAWQLYGIWIGIFVLVALPLAIMITNARITARWARQSEDEIPDLPSRAWRRSRWGWVLLTYAVLGLSAAEICAGNGVCERVF